MNVIQVSRLQMAAYAAKFNFPRINCPPPAGNYLGKIRIAAFAYGSNSNFYP
jgi:hypothetical protein